MTNINSKRILLFFITLYWMPASLLGVELDYTLNYNIKKSNNIVQREQAISGNARTTGVSFDLSNDDGSEIDFSLSGNLQNTEYSVEEFFSERRKDFTARLLYNPNSSNFDFLLIDNYTNVPRNRFATQDVNNLREIDVLVARPRYFFKFSPLDQINFDYTHINFENLNASEDISILYGTRISNESSFGYERKLSSSSSLGVYQSTVDTRFKEAVNDSILDFEQVDQFLRWQSIGQNTQLVIEIGVSDVTNIQQETARSKLKRFTLNRRINRVQLISFRHLAGFDTVLNSNLATNSININTASSDFGTAQEVKETALEYTHNGSLLITDVRLTNRKTSSAIERNTENRNEFYFSTEYMLSNLFRLPTDTSVTFTYLKFKNDFDTIASPITESETQTYRLRYSQPINRSLLLYSEYAERHSSDDNPNLQGDIDSYSIELGFIYRR
jgi:hypothetical protein